MGRHRVPDPDWKQGPKTNEPTADEHALDQEPSLEHDGVGKDEAEKADGMAFHAVREAFSCVRDGCDASPLRIHVYSLSDLSERELEVIEEAMDFDGEPTDCVYAEHLSERAKIVDYDEVPVLGFGIDDPLDDYEILLYPNFTEEYKMDSPCYGRVEPDPDVHAHMYEEL